MPHNSQLTESQTDKVAKVMREFDNGTLFSSSGGKVTDRSQALAIAYSSAGVPLRHKEKNK